MAVILENDRHDEKIHHATDISDVPLVSAMRVVCYILRKCKNNELKITFVIYKLRDTWPWFNIKMSSYQHRNCHCGCRIILRPFSLHSMITDIGKTSPDSKVHGANMGPSWVLPAPDGPHVGPMNLAIRVFILNGPGPCSMPVSLRNGCNGWLEIACSLGHFLRGL